jgi:hypothetical protein
MSKSMRSLTTAAAMLFVALFATTPIGAEPLPRTVVDTVRNFNRMLQAVETCDLSGSSKGLAESDLIQENVKKAQEQLIAKGYQPIAVKAYVWVNRRIWPNIDDTTPSEEIYKLCGETRWFERMMKMDIDLLADIERVYPSPGGKDDAAVLAVISGATAPWKTAVLCEGLRPSLRESTLKILDLEISAAIAELDRFALSDVVKLDAKDQLNAMREGLTLDIILTFGALKRVCDPAQNATMRFDFQDLTKRPAALLKQLQPAK